MNGRLCGHCWLLVLAADQRPRTGATLRAVTPIHLIHLIHLIYPIHLIYLIHLIHLICLIHLIHLNPVILCLPAGSS